MSRVWGGFLGVTGFLACPCHLPLTLPLVLSVLGGTGIGSYIGANQGLVYGIFTGYLVGGIGLGLYLLNRKRRGHDTVCEVPSKNVRQEKILSRRLRPGRRRPKV